MQFKTEGKTLSKTDWITQQSTKTSFLSDTGSVDSDGGREPFGFEYTTVLTVNSYARTWLNMANAASPLLVVYRWHGELKKNLKLLIFY